MPDRPANTPFQSFTWSEFKQMVSDADVDVNLDDVTATTVTASGAIQGGTVTSDGVLTVSAGGITATGNSTITGSLSALTTVTASGLIRGGTVTSDGVLTVSAGGITATGDSTITGTLGSVTTFSAVTGTFTGAISSSSPTTGIGYATGAGGAQTQATDKSTAVASNTITTAITMNAAELAAATIVSFTFTNTAIAATDTVIVTHESAGTSGAYTCNAFPGAGSAVISVRNNTAGALSEAIVLRVTVIKSVSA